MYKRQDWDNRRDMPYAGYEQYEFAVPVEQEGDVYALSLIHI